jgi:hypothetical protein
MSTNNKQVQCQQFTQAADGIGTEIPAKTSVNIGGKAWTQAQLAQVFTTAVSAVGAVTAAKAQLQQLVASQGVAIQAAQTLLQELRQYAETQWGKGSPVLAAFGFVVTQPKQKSSATKAIAAAKSLLTRQARGTLGARQKQAVTANGSVGLVLVNANGQSIPGVTQGPIPPALPANTGNTSSK